MSNATAQATATTNVSGTVLGKSMERERARAYLLDIVNRLDFCEYHFLMDLATKNGHKDVFGNIQDLTRMGLVTEVTLYNPKTQRQLTYIAAPHITVTSVTATRKG